MGMTAQLLVLSPLERLSAGIAVKPADNFNCHAD